MCWCCMCMSVGSGEWIVFQLASLFTGYLIFVCDCCRNFLLPIGAVGRNSFTAQREKLQNVYRKRNHFEGFGVQQTCWEFHWAKIEKLFFLSATKCTTTLHYWKINNKSTHLGAWILRKIIYIRPEGKVFSVQQTDITVVRLNCKYFSTQSCRREGCRGGPPVAKKK